jgi:two-component system, sensor histidine kinase PdtaS
MKNINPNKYSLVVRDNGRGLPVDFNLKEAQTLGLRLINSLVSQIEGDIEVINNGGAEFKITFQTYNNGFNIIPS